MFNKEKYVSFYYETATELPKVIPNLEKTVLLVVDMQNESVLKDFGEGKRKMFKEMG